MADPVRSDASAVAGVAPLVRSDSTSQASVASQTAHDFIREQLQLEADAREALPYQFDTCTRPLGPLRQLLFSCLTCNPPPESPTEPYTPAGVCYSCSISCHCEHTLVELFNKRDFVCDCGSTRIQSAAPCTLRADEKTGAKGNVSGEEPRKGNHYNQNFRNRFCGCSGDYDPHQERGVMFQCLGLGHVEDGGCGEDWWHPECLIGLSRDRYEEYVKMQTAASARPAVGGTAATTTAQDQAPPSSARAETPRESVNEPEGSERHIERDEIRPPGFPHEDEFEHIICYKCVEANPWLKRYAGAPGFLPPVRYRPALPEQASYVAASSDPAAEDESTSRKRKADEREEDTPNGSDPKRQRGLDESVDSTPAMASSESTPPCAYAKLPPAPRGKFSLFVKDDFREYICRCPECFPWLRPFPQLLEEEEIYEPPISVDGDGDGAQSVGTGSLLDRGEAALSNMDRVRAIEGVMVYNHLKDKVKSFLQPFAESGQAVGAEDIKAYFEKLRGDAEAMKEAVAGASGQDGNGGEGDHRKEQGGKWL
jgi:E3 ubiquitin-protein ligase UBR7